MPSDIPRLDPDLKKGSGGREQLEFDLLAAEADRVKAEATLARLINREFGQRYLIRWLAVFAGTAVVLGMAALLWHVVHGIILWRIFFVSPAFSVAVIVAPVVSVTTITVALFVGAFKKFEDKDLEAMGSGASTVASIIRGDN